MEHKAGVSPRIEPMAAEHTPELAETFERFRQALGFVPNSMLILQRKPKLVKAMAQLTAAVWEPDGEVDRAFKRLIAAASQPNGVTEDMFAGMRRHWSETQIVEIAAVVAVFGFLNRWNDTMGTPLEEEAIEVGEKYLAPRGWSVGKHAR